MGMQGCGVKTPDAAAVAAMTCGLAGQAHMAKGWMLTIGRWSMMVAAGWLLDSMRFIGKTVKVEGAAPKLHCKTAPLTTCGVPMSVLRSI